jgi:large subunit ribosomal protein L17
MNKRVFGRKLSRSRPAREALFASLSQAMIKNGKIVTTRAKAKAVIGSIEKMVTLAKKGSIAARRDVLAQLDNKREAVEVLFQKVVKAFPGKTSGYVRIVSLPRRVGDNAQMVRMEWTEKIEAPQVVKVSKVEKVKTEKTDKKVEKAPKGKKEEPKKEIKKVVKK